MEFQTPIVKEVTPKPEPLTKDTFIDEFELSLFDNIVYLENYKKKKDGQI